MKSEEVTAIIANLCTNFEALVQRVKTASKKSLTLERQIELLENKEIADQKEHDRLVDELGRVLETKTGESQEKAAQALRGREEASKEKEVQAEVEALKRKVKELEGEGAQRESFVRQKRQKLSEEDKSLQALIQARNKLEREQQAVEARIGELEAELGGQGGRRNDLTFEQTRDVISLREGKAELKKLQDEERLIAGRVKKVEKQLKEDQKKLEGKRARLDTLRQLNKTLGRRVEEKRHMKERFGEIHEHSLTLQYLFSEAMRELSLRYDIADADVPESPLAPHQEPADQILQRQLDYIGQLKGAVRQRTIQIYKKQYGKAVGLEAESEKQFKS